MPSSAAQLLEENRIASMAVSTATASEAITRRFGRVAGGSIQPVVWAVDAAATGATPDGIDGGLWIMSLLSGPVGWAGAVTGVVKGLVDNDTRRKLGEVRLSEPAQRRPFIQACANYGRSGHQINAMTIASRGGTAWKHQNGLWVYIHDAAGRMIVDYRPRDALEVLQPVTPFRQTADGGLMWSSRRM